MKILRNNINIWIRQRFLINDTLRYCINSTYVAVWNTKCTIKSLSSLTLFFSLSFYLSLFLFLNFTFQARNLDPVQWRTIHLSKSSHLAVSNFIIKSNKNTQTSKVLIEQVATCMCVTLHAPSLSETEIVPLGFLYNAARPIL